MTNQELTEQILALPVDERIRLADTIWAGFGGESDLDGQDEDEILEEVLRRDAELTSGAVVGLTHEEVMRNARRAIGCESP
jgi:putative addiction module component (TIGR02574 family)